MTGLIVDAASDPGLGYATAFRIMGIVSAVCAVLVIVLADPDRDKQIVRGSVSVRVSDDAQRRHSPGDVGAVSDPSPCSATLLLFTDR